MKKCWILLLLLVWACTPFNGELKQWMQPNGKVKVLCTIAMIEDLVKEVGGSYVDTLVLVKGELDPHTYQLVKGDDEKLAFADLIFYNGLGLEHGPSLRESLANNPSAIEFGDLIRAESPALILTYNGSVDPHIWMDVSLWTKTVPYIVETLALEDPEHADFFRERGNRLVKKLTETHQQLKKEMSLVSEKKRYLITSHDAFNYFARAYLGTPSELENGDWQKRFAAPEGLAPESQLSTSDIRHILDHMKQYQIRVIFPESNVSQASIRKLLDAGLEEGMVLKITPEHLYGDAMGRPGSSGDTYIKMITHNVQMIAKHLTRNGADNGNE